LPHRKQRRIQCRGTELSFSRRLPHSSHTPLRRPWHRAGAADSAAGTLMDSNSLSVPRVRNRTFPLTQWLLALALSLGPLLAPTLAVVAAAQASQPIRGNRRRSDHAPLCFGVDLPRMSPCGRIDASLAQSLKTSMSNSRIRPCRTTQSSSSRPLPRSVSLASHLAPQRRAWHSVMSMQPPPPRDCSAASSAIRRRRNVLPLKNRRSFRLSAMVCRICAGSAGVTPRPSVPV
jgi:hypothetical protein